MGTGRWGSKNIDLGVNIGYSDINSPAIGLIVGDLADGKDKEKGGSGLISPFGIDLAIMLGWTFGIFKTFGFTLTPAIAIPIFPIWG